MNHNSAPAQAQLVRLAEGDRAAVSFTLDGRPAMALEGDTVLTAVLTILAVGIVIELLLFNPLEKRLLRGRGLLRS